MRPGSRLARRPLRPPHRDLPARSGLIPARANTSRFAGLDGLRAIAAGAVFFHHVGFWSSATFTSSIGGYLARMDIGVPVFFSISGFLMFRPIVVSVVDDVPLRPAFEHLWRRALRIYPAFWAALAAIVLLTSEAFGSLGGAVTTTLLVHIHWPGHVIGPMPQAWSLATEISFYASLPVLARIVRPLLAHRHRSGRVTGLFAVVAGLYLISFFFRLGAYGLDSEWTRALVLWLPAMADFFAIGMGLAVAHAGLKPGTVSRARLERWAGPAGWWWLASAALFVLVSQSMGLARGVAVAGWPREMGRQLVYGAIGFTLLFPLIFGAGDRPGWLRRRVAGCTLGWLGTVSYSIYLWHMVFIVHPWRPFERAVERLWDVTVRAGWFEALLGWTGSTGFLDSRFAVLTVVASGPTLVVAAATHYMVERAGIALGGRRRGRIIDPTPLESIVARMGAGWRAASFRARLAVIAVGALVVRFGYVLGAKRTETLTPETVFPGDQFFYALAGDALADGKGFVVPWHQKSITLGLAPPGTAAPHAGDHPPLTALVSALAGLLPGEPGSHVLGQRLTMAVIGVAAVVVIGLLARSLAGPVAGLVGSGLAAVHAGFWVNDGLVMSETLVTLTVAGALWAAVRYHRHPRPMRVVELGAWVGAAGLARSEALLLIPLVVVPVVVVAHPEWRERLVASALVLATTAAVLAPWVIPNLVRFAEPVGLSTNVGVTLIGANNSQTYYGGAIGFWTLEGVEDSFELDGSDQSQVSAAYRAAAVDYALDNRHRWPAVVAARVGRVWSVYRPLQMLDWNKGEGREVWASMLAFGGYLVLVPAAVCGWVGLRRGRVWTWPLMAMFVYVTVVAAAFYGLPRLRVPAEIALVVLAAAALKRRADAEVTGADSGVFAAVETTASTRLVGGRGRL